MKKNIAGIIMGSALTLATLFGCNNKGDYSKLPRTGYDTDAKAVLTRRGSSYVNPNEFTGTLSGKVLSETYLKGDTKFQSKYFFVIETDKGEMKTIEIVNGCWIDYNGYHSDMTKKEDVNSSVNVGERIAIDLYNSPDGSPDNHEFLFKASEFLDSAKITK
jgi:hypothetical protein